MFGKKKEHTTIASDTVETVIGKESHFKGTLKASGAIRVDGALEGEILGNGDIIIGESGQVEASIEGRNVIIAGTVHGNVDASGRLEIASTGKLFGDICASSLIIDEGARFQGSSKAVGTVEEKERVPALS
ncbi:polymer-forming cytoskeletal protein [Heliorestis acidaminivorans]|uniref:Polymer-forming cytoskeletal protein n=1 Tax=Heliorestis acidaminivorans TaxID=553427 RepID=A0A6I0EWC1_9FIRM|nr:polymer-forming cytoskeletal protein [Heliorestis acidaminivorans]KAB2953909.1 polymer-forming cytoskeletal protein [Heliorestis acidaminivorans]